MLENRGIRGERIFLGSAAVAFAVFMQFGMKAQAAELPQVSSQDTFLMHQSVSDNSVWDVIPDGGDADSGQPDNGGTENGGDVQEPDGGDTEEPVVPEIPDILADPAVTVEPEVPDAVPEPVQVVDSNQLQTLNYTDGILTDWQQIMDGLRTLSPDVLSNADAGSKSLVLQLQNVTDIPAGIGECLSADGSGYTKYLHCNIGYGASLVFSGASDNSGFQGVSNASVTVDSEKRGKKSMAVTVRFASHEDMGTVASLHVNLPQCSKGTKVSVYAETVSMDADGNVTVGENACIGNTKADENGNVEVLIQSTANYMFVYKAAKE